LTVDLEEGHQELRYDGRVYSISILRSLYPGFPHLDGKPIQGFTASFFQKRRKALAELGFIEHITWHGHCDTREIPL
jgi:hypothetical protein